MFWAIIMVKLLCWSRFSSYCGRSNPRPVARWFIPLWPHDLEFLIIFNSYNVGPPNVISWFLTPMKTIGISTINHSEMEVICTNLAFTNWGPTLHLLGLCKWACPSTVVDNHLCAKSSGWSGAPKLAQFIYNLLSLWVSGLHMYSLYVTYIHCLCVYIYINVHI